MIGHWLALAGGAGLAIAPIAAQAQEPVVMEPAEGSQWVLDYAEDRCRLVRAYGDEDNRSLLMMEQFQPSSGVQMTLAGPPVKRLVDRGRVTVSSGPDGGPPYSFEPVSAHFEGYGPALVMSLGMSGRLSDNPEADEEDEDEPETGQIGLPKIDVEAAGRPDRLTFSNRRRELVLILPQTASAFSVLNHCSRDLISHWGFDLEQHDGMTRPAKLTNTAEVGKALIKAYPPRAIRGGEQGSLSFRATVEPDATMSGCMVTQVTILEVVGPGVCERIGQVAQFEPALDAEGRPMRSYYVTNIIFQIGGG